MKRWSWIWGLGLGVQALVGCSPAYVAQTAQRNPTCEDQCILDGSENLSMCLQECGGGDFTDRLGCQEDDPRGACGGSRPQPRESASGSFLLGVLDAVADVAQRVSDIHDATSSDDAASGSSDDSGASSDLDQPAADPAGPAPEERHEPPRREKKSGDEAKHQAAKPSKPRAPAKPSAD